MSRSRQSFPASFTWRPGQRLLGLPTLSSGSKPREDRSKTLIRASTLAASDCLGKFQCKRRPEIVRRNATLALVPHPILPPFQVARAPNIENISEARPGHQEVLVPV